MTGLRLWTLQWYVKQSSFFAIPRLTRRQILTILILNAVVGVTQESSAEKAIAALQEYSANEAKVVRDGKVQKIKAEELVPGDIVTIAIGDRIPADCRLISIQSNNFAVDQAILTGESESVNKETRQIQDEKAVKQDQINILFSGTTIVTGHAVAVVALTGTSTAIGDIHDSITSQISSQHHSKRSSTSSEILWPRSSQ